MLRITVSVALFLISFSSDAGVGRPEKHRRPAHRAHRKTGGVIDAAAVNNPALAQVVGPGSSGSAVLRAQILLARAHFSCGEIDARYGANLRGAIADFQTAHDRGWLEGWLGSVLN